MSIFFPVRAYTLKFFLPSNVHPWYKQLCDTIKHSRSGKACLGWRVLRVILLYTCFKGSGGRGKHPEICGQLTFTKSVCRWTNKCIRNPRKVSVCILFLTIYLNLCGFFFLKEHDSSFNVLFTYVYHFSKNHPLSPAFSYRSYPPQVCDFVDLNLFIFFFPYLKS